MQHISLSLFAFLSCCLPLQALACMCPLTTDKERIGAAQLIFEGKAVNIQPAAAFQAPSDKALPEHLRTTGLMRATFRVTRLWKGDPEGRVDVDYAEGNGSNCGWRPYVGDLMLVYAHGSTTKGYTTSACSASGNIRELAAYRARLDDIEQRLARDAADPQALRERESLAREYGERVGGERPAAR